jgi:hypothetical protein
MVQNNYDNSELCEMLFTIIIEKGITEVKKFYKKYHRLDFKDYDKRSPLHMAA